MFRFRGKCPNPKGEVLGVTGVAFSSQQPPPMEATERTADPIILDKGN
jgi:hypothetical protein